MKTSGNKSIVGFMGFWMFLAGLLLSGMPLPAGSFAQEKPETEKTIIMGASRGREIGRASCRERV